MDNKTILKNVKFFDLKPIFNQIEKDIPTFIANASMYIPEVILSGTLTVNPKMETSINGLYGAGECLVGINNLLDAMTSGIVAAENIIKE